MTNLKEQFYQTKNIEFLKKTLGRELWVQVSGSKDINGASAAFWAALMPVENIDEAYRDYSWNSYIGTQCPGFIEYGDKITYEANPLNFDSCLNIVQYREFYGIKPNYVEISEEFRLLNNLYHDINTNIFYEIEENGECTEVAKIINNDCAYIKLKSLMKFAAAKQMALLLFFDIRVKISGSLQKNGLKEFSTTVNEDGLFFGLWGGEQRLLETYSYSILMGKRILLPKPVEECGYEPYSRNEENEYPEYIIGIDEYGEPRSYTSNPAKLSNYFGANPGAPHYLTPVFFKKEVLQRYLSRPNIFSVEAGYLRCQSLWGIEIDNEHKDMVSVYLGDLGRDLPVQEHSHWKQYNIATDARLSTNAVKRDFLCAFTQPEISDLKFKLNTTRVSNFFIEIRVVSYLESLAIQGFPFFCVWLMCIGKHQNCEDVFIRRHRYMNTAFRYSYFDMLLQTLAVSCISAFDGGEPHYKNGYTHPRSSENAVQKCIHAGRSPLF